MEKQPKRVSFRLRGVSPGSEMNFGMTNSNQIQQTSSELHTPPSVLLSPPKLRRRMTFKPHTPPSVLPSPPKLKRRMTFKPVSPHAVASLKKELETQRVLHAKQLEDIKSFYKELMNDIRKECATSVEEAKKKQWCVNCFKLAKIYCCWNTSYCDDLCQKKHWYV